MNADTEESSVNGESALSRENKIHFGTCFGDDASGMQLQWVRDRQRMTVHALPAGRARSIDDFRDSDDRLIDEKLEWYSLERDERVERARHADFAWTAYYNLADGKTIKVEGAWDRVPGSGYPEKWARFTLTGNGQTMKLECDTSKLRRPQTLVVVPERLLLPAKTSRTGFTVSADFLDDGTWQAKGFVMPRAVSTIAVGGQKTDLVLRED